MLNMAEELKDEEEEKKELSKTQLRVLVMRSEGMSNKQVAQVLGRHEKTVECHVTEILRRLGARNMIDAIRIATRRKLIV
jgi:DNA-binding NarL/FixJ family response regulator